MCTLVLVDDHSKYVYVQPLLQKSHAFPKLKMIVSYLETQMGKSLKAIQSDQGTEWRSNDTLEWTHDKGIEWQMTVGYNSRQNGCAERMNRSLGEKMQTLLMQRRLPKRFWPYAIWAAAFKMNLAPSVNNEFPYQAMFGKSLEQLMRLLHMFRCLAWVDIPKSGEERMAFLQPRLQSKYILEQLLLADEGDLNDLRYTDENLFDEREEEQLDEYMDMETIDGTDEEKTSGKGLAKMIEHRADAETWANSTHFGLTAIDNGVSPTSSEWQLAPPSHHSLVIDTHLLAPISSLCQAPASSSGVPPLCSVLPLSYWRWGASLTNSLEICHTQHGIVIPTELCSNNIVPTDPTKLCHRNVSTTDLSEFFLKLSFSLILQCLCSFI
ncbi:hypothetical protein NDA17_003740 [Ustilago hordei]|nr:hypothetical protein NDA17_003740 [Ustilago hordei]